MVDCWIEIRKLQGRTLHTLDQRKAFDVVEVSTDDLIVRPHLNRIERKIERWKIEEAFRELAATGQITRSRIRESFTEFHPAYVTAMLAELPGVRYTLKPITLHMKSRISQK